MVSGLMNFDKEDLSSPVILSAAKDLWCKRITRVNDGDPSLRSG
jgi:hypothetical protein